MPVYVVKYENSKRQGVAVLTADSEKEAVRKAGNALDRCGEFGSLLRESKEVPDDEVLLLAAQFSMDLVV